MDQLAITALRQHVAVINTDKAGAHLEAVQVESVDLVVAVPLDGRRRVSSSDAVQHDSVTLDDRCVHRANLEPRLHCSRQRHVYTTYTETFLL